MSNSTLFQIDPEKLDSNEEIKDTWCITVNRDSILEVVFSKPITAREAIAAFDGNDFEDITDEEDIAILDILDIE